MSTEPPIEESLVQQVARMLTCPTGDYPCGECQKRAALIIAKVQQRRTPDLSLVQRIEAACTDHLPYSSTCSISRRDAERIAQALHWTPDTDGLIEKLEAAKLNPSSGLLAEGGNNAIYNQGIETAIAIVRQHRADNLGNLSAESLRLDKIAIDADKPCEISVSKEALRMEIGRTMQAIIPANTYAIEQAALAVMGIIEPLLVKREPVSVRHLAKLLHGWDSGNDFTWHGGIGIGKYIAEAEAILKHVRVPYVD